MKYEFRFYKEEYYDAMIELARKSYAWEVPAVPVSRVEFANTINKEFNDSHSAWEKTIGCYFEDDKLVACTWNEACYDGENMLMVVDRFEAKADASLLSLPADYKEVTEDEYMELVYGDLFGDMEMEME